MVVKCFWKPDDPRINNMALWAPWKTSRKTNTKTKTILPWTMLPSTSATFVVRTLCVRARRTRRPPQNLRQQPFLSPLDGVHPTPLLSQRPISTPGSHVKNSLLFQSLTVRMDGEMVRWDDGTKQLYAGTMFDWSGRLLECVRSLFATSLPLLTAANFCNH